MGLSRALRGTAPLPVLGTGARRPPSAPPADDEPAAPDLASLAAVDADPQQIAERPGDVYATASHIVATAASYAAWAWDAVARHCARPSARSTAAARGPVTAAEVERELVRCVAERAWQGFYPPAALRALAVRLAAAPWAAIARAHHRRDARDALCLARLALVDVAIFVDDSGSMSDGSRVADAAAIVARVAAITTIFDDDGIVVRFINSDLAPGEGDGVRTEGDAAAVFAAATFEGGTNIGTELERKVLVPFVTTPLARGALTKPVLIYVVTDGAPTPEPRGTLRNVLVRARRAALRRGVRFPFGVTFAQVGADPAATAFLGALDDDPELGDAIDAVSDFDVESAQVRQRCGRELNVMDYVNKLLLGSIDARFDALD